MSRICNECGNAEGHDDECASNPLRIRIANLEAELAKMRTEAHDKLGRTFEGFMEMAAKGTCPHCCYTFNGVCDDLCDNPECPEHLRDRAIEAESALMKTQKELNESRTACAVLVKAHRRESVPFDTKHCEICADLPALVAADLKRRNALEEVVDAANRWSEERNKPINPEGEPVYTREASEELESALAQLAAIEKGTK